MACLLRLDVGTPVHNPGTVASGAVAVGQALGPGWRDEGHFQLDAVAAEPFGAVQRTIGAVDQVGVTFAGGIQGDAGGKGRQAAPREAGKPKKEI